MKKAIFKLKNKTYDDELAISNVLNYIYKSEKLSMYCYGLNKCTEITGYNFGTIPKNFHELETAFSIRPNNETIISDLSPNLIHIIIGFYDTTITVEDTFFINYIASLFADEFRVCYSIHNEPQNKNAHIVVCTSNLTNPDNPLTSKLLYNKYIKIIKKIAKAYNYDLNFVKDDERYEYDEHYEYYISNLR